MHSTAPQQGLDSGVQKIWMDVMYRAGLVMAQRSWIWWKVEVNEVSQSHTEPAADAAEKATVLDFDGNKVIGSERLWQNLIDLIERVSFYGLNKEDLKIRCQ